MNLALKAAIVRKFGSQIRASQQIQISETKLSHFIQGHRTPSLEERAYLRWVLGAECFSEQESAEVST
jgi:hypothetical protein